MSFLFHLAIDLLIPILVAIYTFNFGRWLSRQGKKSGSLGAYLWAFFCVAVPAAVAWYNR